MAIITCPECGKELSSLAKACPYCGYRPQKSKNIISWCKIAFCSINIFYLYKRLFTKSLLNVDYKMALYYIRNRTFDGYDDYNFISPVKLALQGTNEVIFFLVVAMIVFCLMSILYILKSNFLKSSICFSLVPILYETLLIVADKDLNITAGPYGFYPLSRMAFGLIIVAFEIFIYKKYPREDNSIKTKELKESLSDEV